MMTLIYLEDYYMVPLNMKRRGCNSYGTSGVMYSGKVTYNYIFLASRRHQNLCQLLKRAVQKDLCAQLDGN